MPKKHFYFQKVFLHFLKKITFSEEKTLKFSEKKRHLYFLQRKKMTFSKGTEFRFSEEKNYIHIKIFWRKKSSLSSHAYSSDFPDSLSLSLSLSLSIYLSIYLSAPIIHHSRQIFKTTSCVHAVVDKFLLVSQPWHVHVKRSIEECHLWVRPFSSSSVPHDMFVLFGCFRDGR